VRSFVARRGFVARVLRRSLRRTLTPLAALVGALALAGAETPTESDFQRVALPAPAGQTNHGAAIAELASGALLACWYSGAHEEGRDVRILCSRGTADGARWSPPWTAVAPRDRAEDAAAPAKSLGNVTLTATPDGRIWMIHGLIQSRVRPVVGETCTGWACGRIDARVSSDEGRSWSPGRRLVDLEGALPRAELKPAGGGYLLPFYLEGPQQSLIASVTLAGDAPRLGRLWRLEGAKLIQPALAPRPGGGFRAYFRDQAKRGVFTAAFDPAAGGFSGLARTNLPNPGAAVDAFSDEAGRTVVIYNPSSKGRDSLALARSEDGTYFAPGCALSSPADHGAAYPSVIRGRDGAWRVVYSTGDKSGVSFVRFTSGWLEKCFAK